MNLVLDSSALIMRDVFDYVDFSSQLAGSRLQRAGELERGIGKPESRRIGEKAERRKIPGPGRSPFLRFVLD